ncbi:sensor histidine kinase [Neiella litorisoli]|nr:ATP-binding protein [Neiella litorisoli]
MQSSNPLELTQPNSAMPSSMASSLLSGERTELLAHLVDELPSGIVVLDAQGVVTDANQAAIDMLGEPLTGIRWRSISERSFRPREDDGHEISLKDGRRIKFVTRAIKGGKGQLIVLTDLTETRQLQERVAHMQRLSSLGKMVASLAHQVRTPLAAATLYAANLGNESLNATARHKFQGKLIDRLKDLENQVNDMLLFARSGEGLAAGELSCQQLLTSIENSVEVMMLQHKAALAVRLPEPDLMITGNSNALSSAISNLVHNALQAEASRVQISANQSSDGRLAICVSDDGKGIPESLIHQIQQPFFTTRSQGTGLGLAVVQAVVQAHQGQLTIRSKPNLGTQVCIDLPLAVHEQSANAVGE